MPQEKPPKKSVAAVWNPGLRVERLIRALRETTWNGEEWSVAKVVLRRTLTERRKVERAGWFN